MQSADMQGGIVRQGGESGFVNGTATYSLQFPKTFFGLNGGLNASLNTIGTNNSTSIGPILNINKGFMSNALSTNFSTSLIHSSTSTDNLVANAFNFRFGARYKYQKRHNFNTNIGYTSSSSTGAKTRNYASVTLGYGFSF